MANDFVPLVNPKLEALRNASGPSTGHESAAPCITLDSEAKSMECGSNYESFAFDMETSMDFGLKEVLGNEPVKVDIINDGTNAGDILQIDESVTGQDSAENSSSFSGTLFGAERDSALSDGEVDSQYVDGHMPGFYFPGFCEGLTMSCRKKRLTDHWTRFIRPLKWRCRWLELKIKELESRALEYDKELTNYEEKKQPLSEKVSSEGFNSRSLAFAGELPRKNVMRRRKRKQTEQTVDIESYMSNHNLFSYYDKRIAADRSLTKYGNGNQAIGNGIPGSVIDGSLYLRDGDTSMEQILVKLVMVQTQVRRLKTRIEKVIGENHGKLSAYRLSLGSAGNISDEEPASPAGNNRLSSIKSFFAASEGDVEDPLLSGQAVPDQDITALPDVVESTKQIEDGVLINNWAAKEELLNFEKVGGDEQDEKKPETQLERPPQAVVQEAALPVETPSLLEGSNMKSSRPILKTYVSNNKRKRRRRGPAAHRKTKRLSG